MTALNRTLSLVILTALVLASCTRSIPTQTPPLQPTAPLSQLLTLELNAQADTTVPLNSVGQVVKFTYNVKNTGATSATGPVTVTGGTCPELNTVGNLDNAFDVNETITCTGSYTLTQADLDRGSITNVATASVSGVSSSPVTTSVPLAQSSTLTLTTSANPQTYDRIGQAITYTYVITNTGAAPLGPAQFMISDDPVGPFIPCGEANTTLAAGASLTCTATFIIPELLDSIKNTATASGGGAATSQPASATITRTTSNSANLVAGSTIQHTVSAGEWLWQIARCYGADPIRVRDQNRRVLVAGTTVTVPNIGSAGTIYGPPCVEAYVVQSGDTWNSIAQKFNADPLVLQKANPGALSVGRRLTVPRNSAGGTKSTTDSTGNCVDLERSLNLAGADAVPTHFTVCGQTDAAGGMRIRTINIYQRPEDVGLGGLSQDITLPATIQTSTRINEVNSLIVGDVNYDGNDDFRIVEFLPAGPNIPYLYYAYDPATRNFVFREEFRKITSPEFPGNSEILSQWREGAAKWGIDTYVVFENYPTLTQREAWEAIDASQARHTITIFPEGDDDKITLDETVPLEASSVTGKVQVGDQSRIGGKAGSPLDIKVRFEATSSAGAVTEMRVKQNPSGSCLTAAEMNDAIWEPFVAEKTYSYTPPINWSTFKLHVQYRDAQGNVSSVTCGEVAVEGMP